MSSIESSEVLFDGRSPDETVASIGQPNGLAETILHAQARNCAARANEHYSRAAQHAPYSVRHEYERHWAEKAVTELRAYVYAILIYRENA